MNKEDKAHLDAIMKSFEQRLAKSKDAQEERQSKEDIGYAEFKRVLSEAIRPAMEDIGNELKAGGHECEILEVGDQRSRREARITLTVTISGVPTSAYRSDNTVSESFYRTGDATVTIQALTQMRKYKNAMAGQRGNYAASDILSSFDQHRGL